MAQEEQLHVVRFREELNVRRASNERIQVLLLREEPKVEPAQVQRGGSQGTQQGSDHRMEQGTLFAIGDHGGGKNLHARGMEGSVPSNTQTPWTKKRQMVQSATVREASITLVALCAFELTCPLVLRRNKRAQSATARAPLPV